jgi:glycosyltransferase involved in cell wall biosynthesis
VQLGIAADLHMPGFVENPLSYMRRASVVAITSRFEGFGNVSVEAMACGTPVIATDAPTGPREITENGSWGTLVPVGDAAAIADAIETAIRTPPDPAGPRHRASFFALSTAAAHYADLIQSLAPATPPPLPPVRGRDDEGSAAAQDPIRAANPYGVLGQHPSGRPLHIALYLGDMSGGGAERVSLLLLEEFAKAGARLDLLLHAARGENLGRIPPSVRLLAFNTRRTALDLLPLAAYLRRATPDILLASLNHNNIVAGFARALAGRGTRLLITQHNALSRETREIEAWNYRILPVAYRLAAPFADRIIAVSAGVADDMARTTAIPRDRFAVLYNPVIDADFAARAAEPVAHRWFGPDGPPIFITAGRLAAQKDHATLLRAFALYRQTQPGRLIILGHGPLRQELAALAARLGVAADVDFAGFQHNPLPYYRHCAAFVLSSRYEGFGNVLVEAMGCGLPVIATDCPHGPAEILQNGRFGQLVPVADPAALAQALSLPLRAQFPAAQLRDRAQHFTSQTAASAYLKLMQQTLPPSP